jgi:hypothetical protein
VAEAFPWNSAAQQAGFGLDAAYLIRPDGHVALAMDKQDPAELRAFATSIRLATPANPLSSRNAATGALH